MAQGPEWWMDPVCEALTILLSGEDDVYILHYALTTSEFMLPGESRVKKQNKT